MSDKLDTAEKILDWAMLTQGWDDADEERDRETAEYLAESVRVRGIVARKAEHEEGWMLEDILAEAAKGDGK